MDVWKNTVQDEDDNLKNPKELRKYIESIFAQANMEMPHEKNCFSKCFPNRLCKRCTSCKSKKYISQWDWDYFLESFTFQTMDKLFIRDYLYKLNKLLPPI